MSIVESISDIVGAKGVLLGDDVKSRPAYSYGQGECAAKAIVRPASTEELSRVMKLCYEHEQTVVPWGGLTGLVNGTTCGTDDIAISMERMTKIETLDADAGVATVQAGVALQTLQEQAAEQQWLFALDLGARGSATIGGAIATNAGGNGVVRYGMMREQVLGLEVVLADGTVMSSMNEMLKNNAGYDLKQLFIGSEGTLGMVTRAVIRLRPLPTAVQTAFLAVDSFANVVALLKRLGMALEGKLSAFEVMWQSHYKLLVEELDKHPKVLPTDHPYYVLVESSGADAEREEQLFTEVLADLMEQEVVVDAVLAQSGQQATQLWEMRDDIEALVHTFFPPVAFDISLPLRHMEAYVDAVNSNLAESCPGVRSVVFGHLGDGNIHIAAGPANDKQAVEKAVYEALQPFGGSVSAEHGIGLDKKPYLSISRDETQLALMRTVKSALDPKNLLNPGKVFE